LFGPQHADKAVIATTLPPVVLPRAPDYRVLFPRNFNCEAAGFLLIEALPDNEQIFSFPRQLLVKNNPARAPRRPIGFLWRAKKLDVPLCVEVRGGLYLDEHVLTGECGETVSGF